YNTYNDTLTYQTRGGTSAIGSVRNGGAGTVYLNDKVANEDTLIVNNEGTVIGTEAWTTQVTDATQTYHNVILQNGANYRIPNGFTLMVEGTFSSSGATNPTLTIDAGGTFDGGMGSL